MTIIGASNAKRLATVSPLLGSAFIEISQRFAAQFPGCFLGVIDGYRTPAAQQGASASGASPFDGKEQFSMHQNFPSLALDFNVLDTALVDPWVRDGTDARYLWVGERFEEEGFRWGGRFVHPKPDWDHVEISSPGPDRDAVQNSYMAWLRVTTDAPFLKLI